MRALTFPQIKTFKGLFNSLEVFSDLKPRQDATAPYKGVHGVMMDHLNKDGHTHFTVKLNDNVAAVYDDMKGMSGGVYFQFVQRSDLSTLVCLKYNSIIGSRWLAIIPPEGMPEALRPVEHVNHAPPGYTTYIHHIAHGNSLNHLVELIGDYELDPFWGLHDEETENGMYDIHGNFTEFSLSFHIETNDPQLIKKMRYNIATCKNLENIEPENLFSNMRSANDVS